MISTIGRPTVIRERSSRLFLENPVSNLKREKGKNGFYGRTIQRGRYPSHTEKDNSAFPWKPICTILDGASREIIKQIDWQIGYDTPDQAERAGLIVSKKWIDAGKPIL